MNKRRIFVGILVVLLIGIWVIYENWPIVQSEAKIRRKMLKKFPVGMSKIELVNYANKNYELPSYRPKSSNQIIYRISKLKGIAVAVVTWEFNRDNEVMDVRVQKNYGP